MDHQQEACFLQASEAHGLNDSTGFRIQPRSGLLGFSIENTLCALCVGCDFSGVDRSKTILCAYGSPRTNPYRRGTVRRTIQLHPQHVVMIENGLKGEDQMAVRRVVRHVEHQRLAEAGQWPTALEQP